MLCGFSLALPQTYDVSYAACPLVKQTTLTTSKPN